MSEDGDDHCPRVNGAIRHLSDTARWDILHHLEEVRAWNRISYEADARIATTGIAVAGVVLALTVRFETAAPRGSLVARLTVVALALLVLSVIFGILGLRQHKQRIDLRVKVYQGDFDQARVRHSLPCGPEHKAASWPQNRRRLDEALNAKRRRWDWGQYVTLVAGFMLMVAAFAWGKL